MQTRAAVKNKVKIFSKTELKHTHYFKKRINDEAVKLKLSMAVAGLEIVSSFIL
jgi:hypothetical protein